VGRNMLAYTCKDLIVSINICVHGNYMLICKASSEINVLVRIGQSQSEY
jgi:hypothetical protein